LFLERFAGQTKLKGLRHIIQDEPDDRFILRQDFNRGIALMKTSGLIYEILIHQHHLPCAVEFVDQHPDQVFVLDHLAKPRIREGKIDPWQKYLANLARRENVYCKISGMVTEADWSNWRPEDLRPYFDVVLDVFGPRRLIAGSDWPVCLLAASYERWWQTLREFLSDLSASEQDCILGTNAVRVYRLDDRSTASDREGAASESAHYQATR
jgi:L-fuconolactonase